MRLRRATRVPLTLAAVTALSIAVGCRGTNASNTSAGPAATLRVGMGQVFSSPTEGLRALAQILTVESLARLGEDGRPQPSLARDWQVSTDGRTLTVNLVPGVTFHDGSPVTGFAVASALKTTLPTAMGPAAKDIEEVMATSDEQVVVRLRRSSPFLLDSLEALVPKTGSGLVGTGPFLVSDPKSPTEFRANAKYHLGRPAIERIAVQTFPTVRAAWAEMLRGRLDMLYEVGTDALDSLETASSVSVFTYARHYQYALIFNTQSAPLRSSDTRRALNMAVDREAVVREALNGHGIVSNGPIWPQNYAFRSDFPTFRTDVQTAQRLLSGNRRAADPPGGLHFTCLTRPDAVSERVALVLKRQFQAIGVDMALEETPMEGIASSIKNRTFEAVLLETISGPTLLRPYQMWHSGGAANASTVTIDAALDHLRYATSDTDYLQAVASFQQAVIDDPPAIFVAWMERARAVSKRFVVPTPESGRDILANLRLWKPATDQRQANRN